MTRVQPGERTGGCDSSEIILFAQPAVDATGHFRSGRPFYAPRVATKQHGERNLRMRLIRIGNKPTNPGRRGVVIASAGLAEWCFISAAIKARLASAVQNGG